MQLAHRLRARQPLRRPAVAVPMDGRWAVAGSHCRGVARPLAAATTVAVVTLLVLIAALVVKIGWLALC